MNIKEINLVKEEFEQLKSKGLIREWELPYENLLTRLSAAIFFITPSEDSGEGLPGLWDELGKHPDFSYRPNVEKKISGLKFRVTFNREEKEKNALVAANAE